MEFDKDQQNKINIIAILVDLQDQYITELAPEFKQGMKQMINRASIHTKAFIKECDRVLNKDSQIDFGATSDDLRVIIERELLK